MKSTNSNSVNYDVDSIVFSLDRDLDGEYNMINLMHTAY